MLGCLCYGGGDWLMMYGDPTYNGTLKWLTTGTAAIAEWRYNLAMALAFPGIIFYGIALFAVGGYIRSHKEQKVPCTSHLKRDNKSLLGCGICPLLGKGEL